MMAVQSRTSCFFSMNSVITSSSSGLTVRRFQLSKHELLQVDGMQLDFGARDPMMTPEGAARLTARLQQYGAIVEHRTLPSGHELSQADVTIAQAWLRSHVQPAEKMSLRR